MLAISRTPLAAFKGHFFTPRGLQGINHLIQAEMKDSAELRTATLSKDLKEISKVSSLPALSRLRIPQSIWVPLIDNLEVSSIDHLGTAIRQYSDWKEVPSLFSFGPRVTVNSDSPFNKEEILVQLRNILGMHSIENGEFSLRVDHDQKMSLSFNAIPPRPWLDSPLALTMAERSVDWWSVQGRDGTDTSRPAEPSETAIKLYRNEGSLSCLCAAFLRSSSIPSLLKSKAPDEVLVWDPFVGNGAMILELLQLVRDSGIGQSPKTVTIVGNVKSKESLDICVRRIEKWLSACGESVTVADHEDAGQRAGRRSARRKDDETETTLSGLFSKSFQVGKGIEINVHLTTVSFQETFPHVKGGVMVSHIPKTYNELTGIDKHELSEWAAFGNLLKNSEISSAMFFTETNSFMKYAKLRYAKLVHLVSPNGKSIGHFSKGIPF